MATVHAHNVRHIGGVTWTGKTLPTGDPIVRLSSI